MAEMVGTLLGLLRGFFCLLVIGITSARLDMRGCGISKARRPRILGGKPVDSTSYPWMVLLGTEEGGRINETCRGIILKENWIVTAAHCVNKSQIKYTVAYVGLRHQIRTKNKHVQKHKLSKIIIHPHYKVRKNGYMNDIALLKTRIPINIKGSAGHINGICLPRTASSYPTGKATLVGWGITGRNCSTDTPDALKKIDITISPPGVCLKSANGGVPETYMCTGGNGKKIDLGRDGGLLFQIKRGVASLIGITSSTKGYDSNKPAVFVRMSSFLHWMEQKMT